MNFLISAKLLYSLVLLVPKFQPEIFRLLRLIFSLKPAVTGFQLGDQYPCPSSARTGEVVLVELKVELDESD